MEKSLSDFIARYRDLERALSDLLSTDAGPTEEELRALDAKVAAAFRDVLRTKLEDPHDNLDRIHFLVAQARQLTDAKGILALILDTIVDDANTLVNSNVFAEGFLPQIESKDRSGEADFMELCYRSEASYQLTPYQLHALCAKASKRNRDNDISGVLTYDQKSDEIFQILEGPTEAVTKLMNSISADPRHRNVAILYQGKIKRRTFGRWSMFLIMSSELRSEISRDGEVEGWVEHRLAIKGNVSTRKGLSLLSASLKSMFPN